MKSPNTIDLSISSTATLTLLVHYDQHDGAPLSVESRLFVHGKPIVMGHTHAALAGLMQSIRKDQGLATEFRIDLGDFHVLMPRAAATIASAFLRSSGLEVAAVED